VRCPPLAWTWKFFTGDFIWKGAFFAIFQQEFQNSTMFDGLCVFKFQKNGANLGFRLNIQKQKVLASGGLRPLTPRPGALPLGPAGGSAPDPRYRLALRALAMAPLCQILNTPLSITARYLIWLCLLGGAVVKSTLTMTLMMMFAMLMLLLLRFRLLSNHQLASRWYCIGVHNSAILSRLNDLDTYMTCTLYSQTSSRFASRA